MAKPKGVPGPDCVYCGRMIGINQAAKAVRGAGTFVGWRHPQCWKPTNLQHWATKYAEAEEFVRVLRSGDRSSLHPALRWGR
ncbi:MAG TPA: hypothetical protein VFI41_05370 [Gemmatimonadales bacterium]|nr:hypothetical protein [Gemmatimonadales bacterium]